MKQPTRRVTSNGRTPTSTALEQAKTEALFTSVGEGIITTDENGTITRVNQVALDILGCKKREMVGKWFPAAMPAIREDGSYIDNLDRPITKSFLTGKTVNEKIFYMHKNGTRVPISVTVSPIMLGDRPIGAVQIFRDISSEIENEKLKTDFISLASHQLRTPLSAINMYAHMLHQGLGGPLTDSQVSFLEVILSASHRMNGLINTLLNITRIEAGSLSIDPQPIQLDIVLDEILAENMPEAEEKNLTLRRNIGKFIPAIATDGLLVKEILSNLLSNAIKYTPEGGVITMSLNNKGKSAIFCVQDTGYGVPATEQKRIFTKFFRAENIVQRDVSGTGIGLYLIKILADNLGGELWFTSIENKGSKFYFSLPHQGSIRKRGQFRLEA